MQWEYKRVMSDELGSLEDAIVQNLYAEWELVGVTLSGSWYAFFKRPKPTPEATPEVEYITPTAEHVGQMVEVKNYESDKWGERTLLAVIPGFDYGFLCQNNHDKELYIGWKYARVAVKR